jgi:hypothetical protein
LWGRSLHNLGQESCGGVHHATPEATPMVEAWAEAKFHVY